MEVQESAFSLDKYWLILKRRWIPALVTFFPVFLIPVLFFSFLKKPAYLAEGKLRFQRTNTTSVLTGVGTEIGRLEPLVQDSRTNPLYTEAEVIRSTPIVQEIINQLSLTDNQQTPLKTKEFLKRLTVKDVKGADVLQISYRDTEPTTAAQVVNTLMTVYLENNVSDHRKQAATARKFIQKQLPNAEFVVRQAEAELAKFKQKYKVVSLQEEATRGVEVIAELQQQISEAQSEFANAEAQSQEIRKRLGMNSQQAVTMTSLSQTSGVQDILREIQQLESQLVARRIVLQENHPQIIDLKDRLKSLNRLKQQRIEQIVGTTQPQLNQNLQLGQLQQQLSARLVELESTRLGLASQAAALSKLQAEYKQRLNNLPRLEQQQRQLERKVQAAQSTYSLLLQKLEESRIAENQNLGNASIISKAIVPEEPISSPIAMYLSASLIAILATLATIYLLEARDKSIKTVDEAKDLLGLTVLGLIPSFSKPKKSIHEKEEPEFYSQRLMIRDFPCSPVSEAYRMLRANLRFMSADKELKVIVVTSSVPKEGKSTVAANLATVMAQMERKILLVDADLHRPIQHKMWELTNDQGLSNVIVGEAEVRTAIKTAINNLDVLTAGVMPPSPASLLDSKKMAGLIESFATTYDFVIIDAPSLTVAADAATLGQMADGVLLVVRPEVVDSVNALFAKEFLEKSGQNVIGQVVNGVIPNNEHHSYYFLQEYYPQESARVTVQ
ncbi:MAG: polysaccharide biosynthesis tyrosine autokinase [Fischerella sp.]|jgi:capsular exopolysaccharide synthesis family protein|uniref:GumC family protein n=1 Tax=Fischerella sp. TaxID=1191 RepID=UPI0017B86D4A|nr:polysaccharide biosynthesis tyrosine autokinase [Fischerella sp.]NWF58837.1 polysaccharide biosynthesis tyrosine autokinase [Fischerella sp.]